jgi:hypothetical protein
MPKLPLWHYSYYETFLGNLSSGQAVLPAIPGLGRSKTQTGCGTE